MPRRAIKTETRYSSRQGKSRPVSPTDTASLSEFDDDDETSCSQSYLSLDETVSVKSPEVRPKRDQAKGYYFRKNKVVGDEGSIVDQTTLEVNQKKSARGRSLEKAPAAASRLQTGSAAARRSLSKDIKSKEKKKDKPLKKKDTKKSRRREEEDSYYSEGSSYVDGDYSEASESYFSDEVSFDSEEESVIEKKKKRQPDAKPKSKPKAMAKTKAKSGKRKPKTEYEVDTWYSVVMDLFLLR